MIAKDEIVKTMILFDYQVFLVQIKSHFFNRSAARVRYLRSRHQGSTADVEIS